MLIYGWSCLTPCLTGSSVAGHDGEREHASAAGLALPVPLTILGATGGKTSAEKAYNTYQLVIASNNTSVNSNGRGTIPPPHQD